MRTFAVGDIHGQAKKLIDILEKVEYNIEEDKLIVIGDLSDGRKDAKKSHQFLKVIEILDELVNKELVLGNHDEFLIRFLENKVTPEELEIWVEHNGFDVTLKELQPILTNKESHQRLLSFYKQFKSYYETDKFIFTHAGFDPWRGFYKSSDEDRMYSRQIMLSSNRRNSDVLQNGKKLVVGHTPTVEFMSSPLPFIGPYVIDLDTGAGYGLPLTIMNMDDLTWMQSF